MDLDSVSRPAFPHTDFTQSPPGLESGPLDVRIGYATKSQIYDPHRHMNDRDENGYFGSTGHESLILKCEDDPIEDQALSVSVGCLGERDVDSSKHYHGQNQDAITAISSYKQDIVGSKDSGLIRAVEACTTVQSPHTEEGHIFVCEVCGAESNEAVYLLYHKLDDHKMPIELSLTHLPGHKTCGNCFKYLSESVEETVAVFLTRLYKKCTSDKCYSCKTCNRHFYLSDNFQIALKLKMLKIMAERQQTVALPRNPTEKPCKKKIKELTETAVTCKPEVQSKNETEDSAKIALKLQVLSAMAEPQQTPIVIGSPTKNPCKNKIKEMTETTVTPEVKSKNRTENSAKIALKLQLLSAVAEPQQTPALIRNPTKKPSKKKSKKFTETDFKPKNKSKTGTEDYAKISETPLKKTPKQEKKKRCKEQILKKKDLLLCPQCGKTFPKRGGLAGHLKTHSSERPFICDVCGKSFKLEKHLKLHQPVHLGEKPFTCDECGRGYSRRNALSYHQLTHNKTKQFQCDICPKAFHRKTDLRYHMDRHNGTFAAKEKEKFDQGHCFVCDVCGKEIASASRLKRHKMTHTGELPYQCEACGRSFSNKCHLREHIACRHKEKTHPCPMCKKMFPTQAILKKHLRLSHAEKSFKCEECTMAFISQKHLDRHMYRHTGKSPHVCENCGRRFSTGTYCRVHQKKCFETA